LQLSALFGAGALLTACTPAAPNFADRETETLRRLVLLYTNDEHGWAEPAGETGGSASMLGLWRRQERYDPAGPFLALSGGDMWTGPAISTWFAGESMVDIMGSMGYAAATLGNHDFDFGLDALRQRQVQAPFPFLSANIRQRSDGAFPDFLRPYVLRHVNGIQVGLVGLTTLETEWDTQPSHVASFDFIPYDSALREVVPQMKAEGAALIVLLGHLCTINLRALAPLAAELGIPILCGGHCHEETVESAQGVTIVQSGSFLHNYIRIALLFDTASGQVVEMDASLQPNTGGRADAELAERVATWREQMPAELFEMIGYAGVKIGWSTPQMSRLITGPWLAAYPAAQAAIYSPRYVQSLPKGEISRASILGMLPTDNALLDIGLSGATGRDD
jgi:2',3'-cyclic-nucleotide 2'-phosphodiesterase (5'-nucleotidase family)